MTLNLLRFSTILLAALLSGLAFAHVLEQPAKMQYDAMLYITLQRSLYVQWGTPHIGGVLEPLTIATTGLLAFFIRRNKRDLWLSVGALFLLLLAFPIVFFWLVAPANAAFLAAMLPNIPLNWSELRSNCGNGPCHAIRTPVCRTSIACSIAAARRERYVRSDEADVIVPASRHSLAIYDQARCEARSRLRLYCCFGSGRC
ncbi:hypothetical protein [Accumulibacter sp.]|uniref:hypothetical protein n=1 Tax=Accumulibacter sp. TaxID=2053492 RepID=UPI001A4D1BD6|nr:hypothetical protein [Accumulibacter sp.]MBL8374649.1 hypothetical protein [Accumulibacter sp.]